ncbi:hypothetical protein HAX54_006394 [Datura stramonium]|uniref:Uncharacterized protein n=1 Tax=Datura stramonium TaxID=4076 RepID=A0ABS8TB16_DATST|nr:hypothetical protein [Datura stramonium]
MVVGKGADAPLQTSNKYAALEDGIRENNQLIEVPQVRESAEPVEKNLNANAPVFKPRNNASPVKERKTKEWVNSTLRKEIEDLLVTTNQLCQEIPSEIYENSSKNRNLWSDQVEKETEEGEVDVYREEVLLENQSPLNDQAQLTQEPVTITT